VKTTLDDAASRHIWDGGASSLITYGMLYAEDPGSSSLPGRFYQ